jgi:ADP-ribosylglycohydrolase
MPETGLSAISHYALSHSPDLLAGEYPRHVDRDGPPERLRALTEAGVTFFVDLTEEDELVPYAHLLPILGAERHRTLLHRRHPVRDNHPPGSSSDMEDILDDIDWALVRGHRVYLHCWGGVGRTGTAAACHLVRHGLSGEAALAEIARLFGATPKGRAGRRSPETPDQMRYVRAWQAGRDPGRREDRLHGALFGLAVGDALGTAVEFERPGTFPPVTDIRGGGPFGLRPGEWTDDTSMALCLAESLVERGGFDPADQMRRYLRWAREGYLSSNGRCFDIGNTVRAALERFERTGEPNSGSTAPDTAGNGSLMRLAPVVMYHAWWPRKAVELAGESSRTTHGAPAAVDACRLFAALLIGAIHGVEKKDLTSQAYARELRFWDDRPLDPAVDEVAEGTYRRRKPPEIQGSGYVVKSLEAALWAFHHTDNFRDGAIAAVNLGDDADTTGAIYGQIAGAHYGLSGIPQEWTGMLAKRDTIAGLAERLGRGR